MTTILTGHISPDTAYVVDDYPYGFRLRCKIRYWLETHPRLGCRMMSQTTNPKVAGERWNKPKGSTYSRFGAALYLDEAGHVQHAGLHEYMEHKDVAPWIATYGAGVPPAAQARMTSWALAVQTYDAKRAAGQSMPHAAASAAIATAKQEDNGNV